MNPSYQVFVDICLRKPVTSESIWLRSILRMPFVPRNGDKVKLTSEDGEDTLELILENITYDVSEGIFIEEQEDDVMVQQYAEDGTLHESDSVASYTRYGFVRLNFPQREAR